MIETKPYNLKAQEQGSYAYYTTIAAFTDRWQSFAIEQTGGLIIDFQHFRKASAQNCRTPWECAFELLALGVLLREHGGQAARLPRNNADLLEWLNVLQDRQPWAEGAVKRLRGLLGAANRAWHSERGPIYAAPEDVQNLIEWLEAHGEPGQAERFREWLEFFIEARPPDLTRQAILQCWRLAETFEVESEAALGQYTADANFYRTGSAPKAHYRYDAPLITRGRLEYHLGMLGTEVLNRAYQEGYRASKQRLVIVPVCMRAQPEGKCQAVQTPMGAQCAGCTPACKVHQVTQLGKKHGVMVVCIPDDELAALCVSSGQAGSGIGVLGVACALRNWSAGWETQKLGLNAQGMLLDYPGCKKHWNCNDVPTEANLKKIEEMIAM